MGLVKKVFDKVGVLIDDKKWKHVEKSNVELEYWVRIFAHQASEYQYRQGRAEDFWDQGIAYMTLNILGTIKDPPAVEYWDYTPDREDYPESEFSMTYKTKEELDEEDKRIIDMGLRSSRGQYNKPDSNWFWERRNVVGLRENKKRKLRN